MFKSTCQSCKGTGICQSCKGKGCAECGCVKDAISQTWHGKNKGICPVCNGTGKV